MRVMEVETDYLQQLVSEFQAFQLYEERSVQLPQLGQLDL